MDDGGVADLVGLNAVLDHLREPPLGALSVVGLHAGVHQDVVTDGVGQDALRPHLPEPLAGALDVAFLCASVDHRVVADSVGLEPGSADLREPPLRPSDVALLGSAADCLVEAQERDLLEVRRGLGGGARPASTRSLRQVGGHARPIRLLRRPPGLAVSWAPLGRHRHGLDLRRWREQPAGELVCCDRKHHAGHHRQDFDGDAEAGTFGSLRSGAADLLQLQVDEKNDQRQSRKRCHGDDAPRVGRAKHGALGAGRRWGRQPAADRERRQGTHGVRPRGLSKPPA
mmetsp:Transcript_99975/g.280083  ORF Transcript_99975/g.280083 Transcript_99975/m.280083 type:complete len:285 (+) Transcript_99975:1211-2065(+)